MATITAATKTKIKNPGVRFNRATESETIINGGLLELAKRAVGNAIGDDKPYTIRINFQNGRIVGSEANPRLSVELLDGRAASTNIDVPTSSNTLFVEYAYLQSEGVPSIENGDSWVARAKIKNGDLETVYVNNDFSEEDRELIKTVLMRGFAGPIRM
jgi:hypothetical protein|nr:MAG TPA: hypothetical protein [Caudoviricetes sp.]